MLIAPASQWHMKLHLGYWELAACLDRSPLDILGYRQNHHSLEHLDTYQQRD
jgi:hypothetical protein